MLDMLVEEIMPVFGNLTDKLAEWTCEVISAINSYIEKIMPIWENLDELLAACEHKKSEIMSPKQYGMSLQKAVRRVLPRYPYLPITPRDLPYQRRSYW